MIPKKQIEKEVERVKDILKPVLLEYALVIASKMYNDGINWAIKELEKRRCKNCKWLDICVDYKSSEFYCSDWKPKEAKNND